MISCFQYLPITERILRVNSFMGFTNEFFYLVIGDQRAAFIDTGYGVGDLKRFAADFTNLPVIVLNTHGHEDHIGGDFLFSSVYICPEDRSLMQNSYHPSKVEEMVGRILKKQGFWMDLSGGVAPLISSVEMLPILDQDIFDLGGVTLEAITMPGHSAGCVSFLYHEQGILFSGDNCGPQPLLVMPAYSQDQTAPKKYSSLPLEQYYQSLKKLETRQKEFHRILNCHKTGELPLSCFQGVVEAVDGVLSGKYPGIPATIFNGTLSGVFSAKGLDPEAIEQSPNGFCGDVIFAKDNLWIAPQ